MSKDFNNKINIYFDTLGCAKNICDTNQMIDTLKQAGYNIVENAEISDVIILNTCAFIEAAAQESIDTFFEYRKSFIDKKIIVAGCLVSRFSDELIKELKEADAFIECKNESEVADLISDLNISNSSKQIKKSKVNNEVYSYVKISDGCDRFCSYCTIPYIRGKYKSEKYDDIVKDVSDKISQGAKEIILVAQDCGAWGVDFDESKDLAWLLENLANKFPLALFRVLYIQPDAINNKLINVFKSYNNIANYFDIPMQHCDESLLEKMNRKGDADSFINLISKIRVEIPDAVIRSTLIVGFPGEAEEKFNSLCSFVNKANFDYLGCFEYSREEGTAAFDLPGQIEPEIKYSRANTIRDIADSLSLDKLSNRVGQTCDVLIEGIDDGRYYGRAWFQAPDVDGYVYISEFDNTKNVNIGDFVSVKIVDMEAYDLVGVINNDDK